MLKLLDSPDMAIPNPDMAKWIQMSQIYRFHVWLIRTKASLIHVSQLQLRDKQPVHCILHDDVMTIAVYKQFKEVLDLSWRGPKA